MIKIGCLNPFLKIYLFYNKNGRLAYDVWLSQNK